MFALVEKKVEESRLDAKVLFDKPKKDFHHPT